METNEAIKQFENTSANNFKLEKLWEKTKELLQKASGRIYTDEDRFKYDELCTKFDEIRMAFPKIDGVKLEYTLMPYSEVFQGAIDCLELDEPSAYLSFHEEVYSQEKLLREYKYQLKKSRRKFVKSNIDSILSAAKQELDSLKLQYSGTPPSKEIVSPNWDNLVLQFRTLDKLLGDSVNRPKRWNDLFRHLHFGLSQDLMDILEKDFPEIIESLSNLLPEEDDPLPISVEDLGQLTSDENLSKKISVQLKWENLTPESFERICSDIFASTEGWQNPKWLTRTGANDRGKDIEVEKIDVNTLTGPQIKRTVVQCKHYPGGTVKLDEIKNLVPLMSMHGKVDLLIVVTSGKFSNTVIDFVDAHNKMDRLPSILLWSDWDLERILLKRPDLLAQYSLT